MSNVRQAPRHLIWPIILIALGLILLLQNFGYLPWSLWQILARFWPVILILLGVELLLNRTNPWLAAVIAIVLVIGLVVAAITFSPAGLWAAPASTDQTEHLTQELGEIERANVEVQFGAGDLAIKSLSSDSTNLMEGEFDHKGSHRSVAHSYRCRDADCTLRLSEGNPGGFPFGTGGTESWRIALTPNIPLSLAVQSGASHFDLDLTGLRLPNFKLDIGASNGTIKLPAAGATKAIVKAGAADLTLEVPAETAARVRARGGLIDVQVDERRFPREGDYYVSPGFNTASDRIEIELDAGASSIKVR